MWYEFLMKTYTIALPIALGYIVWLLQQQRTEKKKDDEVLKKQQEEEKIKRDAEREGTKCLLRVQLIEYHDKYLRKGSIPSYAYENYVEMFEAYTKLGGNGMIKHMKKEIDELHFNKIEE